MILAAVILCSLLFVVFTLVKYFEAVSPLKQAVPQLRSALEAKRGRLAEYEQRIKLLRDSIPSEEARLSRMESWVRQLTEQHDRLKALQVEKDRAKLDSQIPVGRDGGA